MKDIAEWLASLDLGEYAQRFAENAIDLSVIRDLTENDLEKLGVANLQTGAEAPLQIRVGIATGVAVVGDLIGEGGSQEQAVVGDVAGYSLGGQKHEQPAVDVSISCRRRQRSP
jgi:hypothetical protein